MRSVTRFVSCPRRVGPAAFVLMSTLPSLALASPIGGGPLLGFGNEVLSFLTGPLAYVVTGIGIAVAAISLVMGSRDGLQKALWAVVGGGLLFGARAVVDFIASAA